ncbi:hypothetical protein [Chlamydia felis Fe/C-56]|uniref:Uncharacterized protein n=1 Tax=Chlamydia felis (strain Fe/C-56) TaxID=264202 RepID=Q254Z6_CHLFF|nr:hypothetical protein [Chlamydia felis Fe/C-56]
MPDEDRVFLYFFCSRKLSVQTRSNYTSSHIKKPFLQFNEVDCFYPVVMDTSIFDLAVAIVLICLRLLVFIRKYRDCVSQRMERSKEIEVL